MGKFSYLLTNRNIMINIYKMKKFNSFCFNSINRLTVKACLAVLFLLGSTQVDAQIIKEKRFVQDHKWKVSLQATFMDTNFDTDKPINTENWSTAFPSKIAVERELINNLSFEASYSMNKIKKGNNVNGLIANDDLDVFSIDGMFKYSLGGLFNIPIVDPYLGAGMGYMELDSESKTTLNIGGGVNIWIADTRLFKDYVYTRDRIINRFGLNIEAIGKKNVATGPGSNLQLSAGIFYVF